MGAESITSAKAASSLRLGLLSFVLTALTGVPAVVRGLRGLAEIRRGPGVKGRGLAWAGIGTGLVGTGLGVVLLMITVERVQDAADRTH
jgi:hypothetical protein